MPAPWRWGVLSQKSTVAEDGVDDSSGFRVRNLARKIEEQTSHNYTVILNYFIFQPLNSAKIEYGHLLVPWNIPATGEQYS